MSLINVLRSLVIERLTAAAEEILGAFERTIAEYEEELVRQRRLLDVVFKPRITLHRIGVAELSDPRHCEQERSPSLAKDPESPRIKEEQQQFWLSQHTDQILLDEEADTSESPFTPLCDGNNHSEDRPLHWKFYHTKSEGDTELPAVTSFELTQPGAKEDNFIISEPTSDHHTLSNCCPLSKREADKTYSHQNCVEAYEEAIDRQERLLDNVLKAKITFQRIDCLQPFHQHLKQERSPSLGQQDPKPPHIKEEQQELGISQQEEQLQLQEKADFFYESTFVSLSDRSGLSKDQSLPLHPCQTWSVTETPASTSSELTQSDANEDGSPKVELTSNRQTCSQYCYAAETSSCGNHKEAALTQSTDEPHKKLHKCHICGKECYNSSHVKCHMRTHTGERPFRCTTCGKEFIRKCVLERHTRTHTGERPFKCTTCGKMFSQSANLQKHIRTHTGEKPFRCHDCGKEFNSNWNLKQHVMIHTGERPHTCGHCNKTFTVYSAYKRHLWVHTGETPHRCKHCGRGFSNKSCLITHLCIPPRPKPYQCNICGKNVSSSSSLKMHTRIHTGEKPHKCSTCGKAFTNKGNLNVHIRKHTGTSHTTTSTV